MRTSLAGQLPGVLADDAFLSRFVGIFDELNDSVQAGVDVVEHVVDPTVSPPTLVRWLGGWLGVESIDPSAPELDQRIRVMVVGQLLWWRGTATGLRGLLGLLTDGPVEVSDSGGVFARDMAPPNSHTVSVRVSREGRTTDEHLLAVVRAEVPADVSFELTVGDRVLWPPAARRSSDGNGSGGPIDGGRTRGIASVRTAAAG